MPIVFNKPATNNEFVNNIPSPIKLQDGTKFLDTDFVVIEGFPYLRDAVALTNYMRETIVNQAIYLKRIDGGVNDRGVMTSRPGSVDATKDYPGVRAEGGIDLTLYREIPEYYTPDFVKMLYEPLEILGLPQEFYTRSWWEAIAPIFDNTQPFNPNLNYPLEPFGLKAENIIPQYNIGDPYHLAVVTTEFSTSPWFYELPDISTPYTHFMLLNLTTEYDSFNYGNIPPFQNPVSSVSPDTTPFGIILERKNTGNLELRIHAPSFPEFENEVGVYNLGTAINHVAPEVVPIFDGEYVFGGGGAWNLLGEENVNNEYLLPQAAFANSSFLLWRGKPGYCLEVFLNEDRTKFAVSFNGVKLFPAVTLPEPIRQKFVSPTATISPSLHFMTNLDSKYDPLTQTIPGESFPTDWPFQQIRRIGTLINLLAVGADQKQWVDPLPPPTGTRNAPFYMNRPDGLVSAPPWANLGSGWPGFSSVDRAALWQRNNPR